MELKEESQRFDLLFLPHAARLPGQPPRRERERREQRPILTLREEPLGSLRASSSHVALLFEGFT